MGMCQSTSCPFKDENTATSIDHACGYVRITSKLPTQTFPKPLCTFHVIGYCFLVHRSKFDSIGDFPDSGCSHEINQTCLCGN